MPQTIIVVPCYNEAKRLAVEKFESFATNHPEIRFVMMNDGSTDETLDILRHLQDRNETQFSAVDLQPNRGKAEAVRRGLLIALREHPRYVGFLDADLATPLEALLDFEAVLAHRPDLEIVFGSRVRLLGRMIERRPLRHYLGRIFASAASLVLGLPVYDTQCGAKLFRNTPTMLGLFDEPFITRWIFDVELLARLIAARRGTGLRQAEEVIYEFPLETWSDVAGSKVHAIDFPKAFFEIMRIYWKYMRHPRVP